MLQSCETLVCSFLLRVYEFLVEMAGHFIEISVQSSENIRRIFSIVSPPNPDLSWGIGPLLSETALLSVHGMLTLISTSRPTSVIKHPSHRKGKESMGDVMDHISSL